MNYLKSIVHFLNDAQLVANIQSTFGLRFHSVLDKTDSNISAPTLNKEETRPRQRSANPDQLKQSKNVSLKTEPNLKQVNMLHEKICQYSVSSKLFYYFFMCVTRMGNEVFYIIFLPVLLWNFDERIMLLTAVCWSLTMYIGQATKDLVKIPRPQTPPVVKLEEKYLLEYGFPSTHSMAAMTISFTIIALIFADKEVAAYYDSCKTELLVCACVSCVLVSLSRVYLGMHSLLDVIGGLLYAFFLSLLFFFISDAFLNFIKKSPVNGGLFYLFMVLLCVLYPCKDRWSSARSDTFLILGAGAGVAMAYSLKAGLKWASVGKLRYASKEQRAMDKLGVILMRNLVGSVALLIVRNLSKKIFYLMLRLKPGLAKFSGEKLKEHIKQHFSLDLCFYFFTYSNVGFTAVFTSFVIFEYFKIY